MRATLGDKKISTIVSLQYLYLIKYYKNQINMINNFDICMLIMYINNHEQIFSKDVEKFHREYSNILIVSMSNLKEPVKTKKKKKSKKKSRDA